MPGFPISIKMLMTLNTKELSRFKEYIASPYFNKSQRVTRLFRFIEDSYLLKKKKYDQISIVKKNYGIYNEANIRKFKYDISILKEHFEDFVSLQVFENNDLEKRIIRLEDFIYRSKGIFFKTEHKNLDKKLKSRKNDSEHFYYKFKIENLKSNYELIYNDKRIGDVNLQVISDNIDKDFLTKKLTYSVLMLNRRNIASVDYNFGLKDIAIQFLGTLDNVEEPIIQCLFYAYKILFENEGEKNYKILKKLLTKYQNEISDDIVNILYVILQNKVISIFSERQRYSAEFFDLYSTLLERGLMRLKGKISAQVIKNMVTACLELDKYDYLEKFLLDNRYQIYPEVLSEDIFNFNFSKMLLYKGEVEKAFEMIINVKINDLYYRLALRRLEIMICYEMKNYRHLDYLVDAFRVALTPNRAKNISKHRLEAERNFINYFLDIFRISSKRTSRKKYIETLLQNIAQATNVSDQKWLCMKAEELLNK